MARSRINAESKYFRVNVLLERDSRSFEGCSIAQRVELKCFGEDLKSLGIKELQIISSLIDLIEGEYREMYTN